VRTSRSAQCTAENTRGSAFLVASFSNFGEGKCENACPPCSLLYLSAIFSVPPVRQRRRAAALANLEIPRRKPRPDGTFLLTLLSRNKRKFSRDTSRREQLAPSRGERGMDGVENRYCLRLLHYLRLSSSVISRGCSKRKKAAADFRLIIGIIERSGRC